ncbi:Ribonucleotide reductase of class III (anaerobic), activating protein [hydrothermal vent metagenome]|uniref:Ribonucleotide reductase of class III (Anaerobic), activating protein n=1 Tax=hydrothermal vent metagenome TaxID=652676 RepID=A0A3B0VQY3_9ZZZZ
MIVANIPAKFSWRYILNFMHTRKGLLEAVVFSGGEPLLQKDLPQAIAQIREMGFKIGIHTAGSIPQRFQEILTMVDWVGFDIKDLANSCDDITQVKHSGKKNWQSLAMLLDAQVEYQCRTTIHWQLIDEDRLIKLTQKLAAMGVINYAIQFARTTIMHDKKLGHSTKAADKIAYLQARLQNILPSIIFSS